MASVLLREERKNQILQYFNQSAQVTVSELSKRFQVSEATVRRDLQELAVSGAVRRTHGGALRAESAVPEAPVNQRASEYPEEKRRIGEAAAELIANGETVF